MPAEQLNYPDYRWRRRWRLGNWYVLLLLGFAVATLAGGSVAFAHGLVNKQVFVGTLIIPIFVIVVVGFFAGMNSVRMALDRWNGTEDDIAWPTESPEAVHWASGIKGGLLWHMQFIVTFYIYSSGFGWVGGSIQRAFVPWDHVLKIEQGMFSGIIEYARNGTHRHIVVGSVKPLLKAYNKACGQA